MSTAFAIESSESDVVFEWPPRLLVGESPIDDIAQTLSLDSPDIADSLKFCARLSSVEFDYLHHQDWKQHHIEETFRELLERFPNDDQRKVVARVWLESNPLTLCAYIDRLKIADEETRVAFACSAAARDAWCMATYIRNFEVSDESSRIQIAKIAASNSGLGITRAIKRFEITNQDELTNIAIIAARNAGVAVLGCSGVYGITDSDSKTRLRIAAFMREPLEVIEYLQEWNPDSVKTLFPLALTALYRSDQNSYLEVKNSLRNLCEALPKILDDDSLLALNRAERLKKLLELIAPGDPALEKIKSSFAAEVQTEEEVLAIAAYLITSKNRLPESVDGKSLSRWALRNITGFNAISDADMLSSNSARHAYGVLLDFAQYYPNNSSPIVIDDACWSKQDRTLALEVLVATKAVDALGGEILRGHIYPGGLHDEFSRLNTELANLFESKLGITSGDTDTFIRLQQVWGDLTPLFILYGRLQETEAGKKTLPIFREIVESCLEGTFQLYKYQDYQLPFEEETKERWKENPTALQYVDAAGGTLSKSEEELLQEAMIILNSNLRHHLKEGSYAKWEEADPISFSTGSFIAEMKKVSRDKRVQSAFKALFEAAESQNREQIEEITTTLRDRGEELDLTSQVREDLKSVLRALAPSETSVDAGYLILSAISDDPRLLITVGDLVETSSCQNYRTGSHVNTLLGYVADANIKAAVSFAIPLRKLRQFPGLNEAIVQNLSSIAYTFDAAKLTLDLFIPGEADPVRIPLGKAMRRHILRLGTAPESGEPALFVERGYVQNHSIDLEIERLCQELIVAFREKTGAVEAETGTEFPATRNPAGIYSDACGGVMKGVYTL